MKTMISILAISALSATAAMAQTSTETAPANVSTATATEASPSKWGVELISESFTYVGQQNEEKGKAPLFSSNAVGLVYSLTPATNIELRQYADYASDGSGSLHDGDAWALDSTMLRLGHKTGITIGESSPLKWNLKYYAPNNRVDSEAKRIGMIRTDVEMNWNVTPKLNISINHQTRTMLNSGGAARANDIEYFRMKVFPIATYNFSDAFNVYWTPIIDTTYSNAQYGDLTADVANITTHEIGVNYMVGAWTINPAIDTGANNANGDASILTADSRVYAHENSYYCLNVYASF